MADKDKDLEAPKQEEARDLAMTAQEFQDALDALFKRAKAAGVRPLKEMAQSYAKKGLGAIEGLLAAMEEGPNKAKKG